MTAPTSMRTQVKAELRRLSLALAQNVPHRDKGRHLSTSTVDMLDTAVNTDNLGDEIIMSYATNVLKQIFPNSNFTHIPTHGYSLSVECARSGVLKFACGTNMIAPEMAEYGQLMTPLLRPYSYHHSVCLLAVGLRSSPNDLSHFDHYSARFLRYMLSPFLLHSVRDENTKTKLAQIGITNVVNTSCVTMWNLTEDFCAAIPHHQHHEVLTTVTNYARDPIADRHMLQVLRSEYSKVHLWVQADEDPAYVSELTTIDDIDIIPHSKHALDAFLNNNSENIDYVGTRLHAGIHCLNHHVRSLIIEVDNRARDIAHDTNLPVVKRAELREQLTPLIRRERPTDIHIPSENIERWKNQFSPRTCDSR